MSDTHAIVGAGIAGASIAYHLGRKSDDDVVVFERGSAASETTARSVAQFGFYGDATQYRMKRYGMQLYNEFFSDPRASPAYEFAGLLSVATDRTGAADLERAVEQGGDPSIGKTSGTGFGRDLVEYIPGDELTETLLVPLLADEPVEGALYRPKMGYMTRPSELAYEFIERAEQHGVEFVYGAHVDDISVDGNGVSSVVVNGEDHPVDTVICAGGPWNVQFSRLVGIDPPIHHTLAPVLKLGPETTHEYTVPAITHHDGPCAVHRRGPREFLVGYNPPGGYDLDNEYAPDSVDDTVPAEIRAEMLDAVELLTPSLLGSELVDEWVGIRSQTPDGNPIVGWTGVDGFLLAAFHTSGIQLAPAVGRIIADQVVDDDPTELYEELSISRFDGYTVAGRG